MAKLTPEMEIVEMAKYLGVSYGELMKTPAWFIKVAAIRMKEETEFAIYQNKLKEKS